MKPVFKTLMARVQTGDDGTTTVIASTPEPDRMGDIVSPDWNLDRYATNPIIAWSHDYSIPVIGRAVSLGLEGDTLVAKIKWDDSDANPLGRTVAHQYREGFLSAVSVGFAPGKSTPRNELSPDDPRYAKSGSVFTQCELLEISAVAIPANADCVAIRAKAYGLAAEPVQRHVLSIEEDEDTLTITMAKEPEEAPEEEPEEAPEEAPEEEPEEGEQQGLWDEPDGKSLIEVFSELETSLFASPPMAQPETPPPVRASADDAQLTERVRGVILDLFGTDPAIMAALDPEQTSTAEGCGLSALFSIEPTQADPV